MSNFNCKCQFMSNFNCTDSKIHTPACDYVEDEKTLPIEIDNVKDTFRGYETTHKTNEYCRPSITRQSHTVTYMEDILHTEQ